MLDERGIAYDARDAKDMDITDRQAVEKQVTALKPAVIYHCAAYTAVDSAEDEGKEINWRVNEDGTRNLAEVAVKVGAKLVYLSTDYVFDGTKTGEYEVGDPTNPKNEYGKAKLAGEKAIQATMTDYYIIRTSWVFGEYGVYQLSNEDSCSWYEFACEILKDKDVEVVPVTSEEYPQKAYRPRHSIMSLKKAEATGFTIPTWQNALQEFMNQIQDNY